jgi:hypothetical protein
MAHRRYSSARPIVSPVSASHVHVSITLILEHPFE